MISNLRQFLADTEKLKREPARVTVEFHRSAHRDMIAGCVQRSAVDPDRGELRGGWVSSIGVRTAEKTGRLDKTGAATILANEAVIQLIPPYSISFGQNPVDHAPIVEFRMFIPQDPGPSKDPRPGRFGRILVAGGASTQSPQGMAGITTDEVNLKYQLLTRQYTRRVR